MREWERPAPPEARSLLASAKSGSADRVHGGPDRRRVPCASAPSATTSPLDTNKVVHGRPR
jgi:hypothetical protein